MIQNKVEDRLSDALLGDQFSEGDVVLVDVNEDNEIVLKHDNHSQEVDEALEVQA